MDTKKDTRSTGLDFASDGNFHWAGATYRSLGGTGSYSPRAPVLSGARNKSKAEDDITWADQPKWRTLRTHRDRGKSSSEANFLSGHERIFCF